MLQNYSSRVVMHCAVVEVNVVDTSGNKKVDDATFPRPDATRHSSWNSGGNSIRLTGDTIKELGADGQFSSRYCENRQLC